MESAKVDQSKVELQQHYLILLLIQVEHGIDEADPFYVWILQEGQCHEDEEVNGDELIDTMMAHSYEHTPGQQKHADLHSQILQHLENADSYPISGGKAQM